MMDQLKGQQFRMLAFWIIAFIFLIMCYGLLIDWQDQEAPTATA